MTTRDEWVEKIKQKIDEGNAEIDRLRKKADRASADAPQQYRDFLIDLRAHRDTAQQRLQELRASSEAAYGDLRLGAERAWQSMADAITNARQKF